MNDNQTDRLATLAERAGLNRMELTSSPLSHATGTVVHLTGDNVCLIGKIHRSRTRHDQEVRAYRDWTPRLAGHTPKLLASDPELPGIVLTTVPGTPLDELDLSAAEERTVFSHAGRLLRTLHTIPGPGNAARITSYLAERAEHWITDLGSRLTLKEAALVRDHMRALTHLTTARVAPCHLDFQPRNLLWHPEHGLHLIDFEHARPDLAARDLVRLATRHWTNRLDLKTAFLNGYGPLSASDAAVLQHCAALDATTTLVYGHRHGEMTIIAHAHTLLERLGQSISLM